MHMRTMIMANGAPNRTEADCSAPRPPATSKIQAMAAIAAPQASLIQRFGSCGPPVERLPSTTVPASAPATKKIQSTRSVRIDMGRARGN